MITEQLMKVGGWDLKVHPVDTPWWLRRRMTFFSNIVVTAAHVGPVGSFDGLKDVALYSGVITRRALRRGEFSGWGLLGYLATGKASAGIWHNGYEALGSPATFADLIDHWFDDPGGVEFGNGLREGTNHAATATILDALSESTLPDMKQTLDTWAQSTGNEYRVTPQGLIDYGTTVYQTRNILVSPDVRSGVSGDWQLWEPSRWDPEADVEDYRNTGRVLIQDKSNSGVGPVNWALPNVVPRMRTWNNSYSYTCIYTNQEKTVESMSLTDATNVAVGVAGSRAGPHFTVGCDVDVTAPTTRIVPGDRLWVYDSLEGIQGVAHTGVPGMDVAALEQRLYGVTWPIVEGMGVYLVDGTFLTSPAVPEVFDLTPWVQWEDGPAQLELGEPVSLSADRNLAD